MSAQSATNKTFKQINMTLQSYSFHFTEIKTTMTDLKSLVDQIKTDMAVFTIEFQEFEMCFDVTEVKLDDLEFQNVADHKDVIKHELESAAKILRIQNVPLIKMKFFPKDYT